MMKQDEACLRENSLLLAPEVSDWASYISLRPDTERAVFGLSGMPRKIKKVNVD